MTYERIGARYASRMAMVVVLASLLGACRQVGGPAGDDARSQALATLTAAAAPEVVADSPTTAPVSQTEQAATPLAPKSAGDLVGTPPPGGTPNPKLASVPTPAGDVSAEQAQFKAAKATENAQQGIADVSELITRQPALATFTPAPSKPVIPGRLLYVRNGSFYSADASGSGSQKATLSDPKMPAVWAPPEDPGRAWQSPDSARVAFFAGSDAQLWIMNADGTENRSVSGDNLPSDLFDIGVVGGSAQPIRLRPTKDYTLILTPGGATTFALVVDNNERHVKGEGRVRIIHAAAAAKSKPLVAYLNGQPGVNQIGYGRSGGEERVQMGPMTLEIRDSAGQQVLSTKQFQLAERELKTIFIYGENQVQAVEATYDEGKPPAGASRVRIFNAGSAPISVMLDGKKQLAKDLAAGGLGAYVSVPAVLSDDQRKDMQLSVYGMREGENPVVWSPDGTKVAFVGSGDGELDLYVTSPSGPATRITTDPRNEINPAWSPESKQLAWISSDESTGTQTVSYLLAGQAKPGSVNVDSIREQEGWGAKDGVRFVGGVEWADEDRLALIPTSGGTTAGIYLYDVRNGSFTKAYPSKARDPHWSPQAKAWVLEDDAKRGELFVVPLDGKPKRVVDKVGNAPIWSPDGKLICWTEGAPTDSDGWKLHVMNADGTGDHALTDHMAIMQEQPPVPGPRAKRFWLEGGKTLAFTVVGHDYGASERAGVFGREEAGNDIENVWFVATDGSQKPRRASDLTKTFYLRTLLEAPSHPGVVGLSGFSYLDRSQQLWTFMTQPTKPVHIDANVRWFMWLK